VVLHQIVKILTMLCMQGRCQTAISKLVSVSNYIPLQRLVLTRYIRSDIADVSHFVLPDTPMDSEAASRGTTVYLVDKRIDMLPALLGTNLCSLRPFVERLAFSTIWVSVASYCHILLAVYDSIQEMTPDAEIVNVRFTKSVIASKAAFTYEEAQIRKDDPYVYVPLANRTNVHF